MTKKELIKTLTGAYYETKSVELTTSTLNCFTIQNEDILDFLSNELKSLDEECYNAKKGIRYINAQIKNVARKTDFVVCENCNRDFYLNEEILKNVEYREYGLPFVTCPYCDEKTVLDYEDSLDLDEHNLSYPQHFSCMRDSKYVCKISDKELNEQCKKILAKLKNDEVGAYELWATGDSIIIGMKFEEEYTIYVARNYDEVSIPNYEEEK